MNVFRRVLGTVLIVSACCSPCMTRAETTIPSAPATALCPRVGRRPAVRLQQLQETITAPQTIQEIEAWRNQLTSGDTSRRYPAIVALAFAGDLEVFKDLLAARNASDIHTFALSYHNSDGSRCLAAELEHLIIGHLGDPSTAKSLFGFFSKNLYHSQALFDALMANQPALTDIDAWPRFVQSLTATNLPGIAARILVQATTFSAAATRPLAASVLDTQKTYVTYFARRRYIPALDYIATLLNTLHVQQTTQHKRYAQTAITNMRSSIYRALAHFPSPHSARIALAELAPLTRNPWQPGMTTLLTQLGDALNAQDTTEAHRNRAAQHIAAMLAANLPLSSHLARQRRPRGVPSNYEVRRHSYRMLVAFNTRAAADVLLDDLQRVLALPHSERPQALLSPLLESLQRYPATTGLDMPRFLQMVTKLDEGSQLFNVPDILAQHPQPEAYAYLLSMLELVLRTTDVPRGKTIIADKKSYRRLLSNTYAHIFNLVMQYDAPQELARTRQHIDHLYYLGILPERRYVTASERINTILGDQSPQYVAYRQEQDARRAEDTRRKQQQYFDELRAKDHVGKYASPDTIKHKIQALSESGNVKQIARQLIVAGPAILPYAHAALAEPASSLRTKIRLLEILGVIGDTRSVLPVIAVARSEPRLYRNVLLALSKIPQTAESFDFASQQLTQHQDPMRQSSALMYVALHRDRRARAWAVQYASPDTHPDVGAAALYLAASLGEQGAKSLILEMLRTPQKRSRHSLMLRALAELAGVDEFKTLTTQLAINQNEQDYRNLLRYVEFRQATGDDKIAPAEAMLVSRDLFYPTRAARYLIMQKRMDVLAKYLTGVMVYHLPLDLAVMQSSRAAMIVAEARRMGYRIEETAEGLRLIKRGG